MIMTWSIAFGYDLHSFANSEIGRDRPFSVRWRMERSTPSNSRAPEYTTTSASRFMINPSFRPCYLTDVMRLPVLETMNHARMEITVRYESSTANVGNMQTSNVITAVGITPGNRQNRIMTEVFSYAPRAGTTISTITAAGSVSIAMWMVFKIIVHLFVGFSPTRGHGSELWQKFVIRALKDKKFATL